MEVVQQGPQRADVEDREPTPALGGDTGQQREYRRLGLSSGGGGQGQDVLAGKDRADRLILQRAQRRPAE